MGVLDTKYLILQKSGIHTLVLVVLRGARLVQKVLIVFLYLLWVASQFIIGVHLVAELEDLRLSVVVVMHFLAT